jgi:uncharacterized protein
LPGVTGEEERETVTWGLGDAALGIVLSWGLTILLSPLILAVTGASDTDNIPLRTVALLQVPLDGTMVAVALWVSIKKGRGPVLDFGLAAKARDVAGVVVGAITQYAALLVYLPLLWSGLLSADDVSKPARDITDKATDAPGVVLLVLIVVVAAPICEELFFRGLVLRAIERRYGRGWAVAGSSVVFAAAHFEPLQFPALFLFGLVTAIYATRTGRLAPGMWAHMAFNGVAVVSLLH